jgi:hypothetical protein
MKWFPAAELTTHNRLGTDRIENISPNNSSIVAACGYRWDRIENTNRLLLFTAINWQRQFFTEPLLSKESACCSILNRRVENWRADLQNLPVNL